MTSVRAPAIAGILYPEKPLALAARVSGLATSSADGFARPLGVMPVDDDLRRRLLALPWVQIDDQAHAAGRSIEVQLRFLQRRVGDFGILPLVVGDAEPEEVSGGLDAVWGGKRTLVVVSRDLSHFLQRRADMCLIINVVDAGI